MKPEEAINRLINRRFTVSMCIDANECLRENFAIDTAIDALEKQIPRPPIDEYKGNVLQRTICPNCEHIFDLRKDYKFCPYCGQAIYWSDEE